MSLGASEIYFGIILSLVCGSISESRYFYFYFVRNINRCRSSAGVNYIIYYILDYI